MSARRFRRACLIGTAAATIAAATIAASTIAASLSVTTAAAATPASPGATAGLPSKQQQIKVLDAALATMTKNYKALDKVSPGVGDIWDYGISALWKQGIDGAGTTVAVIEGWNYPGVQAFLAKFDVPLGLPAPQIQTIYPDGPLPKTCPAAMLKLGSYGSCAAWEFEAALDVFSVHLMAPYAKIIIAATPAGSLENDGASQVAPPEMMKALEYISAHHLANVMSISDGTGETTYKYGKPEILAQDPGELAAAATGIPVLVSTGDCGTRQHLVSNTSECTELTPGPDTAVWDDSPWVTAVGGSIPNVSPGNGARLGSDPVWGDGPGAEGAGSSGIFARPDYQNSVAAITHSSMRTVPDITMDAGDGTSEATPLLAGVLALATQVNHGDLGPINPALYNVLGPAGAADGIADVVKGSNALTNAKGKVITPGLNAAPGFDVASGWGTLYAPLFVPSLVAATQASGGEWAAREQARVDLAALEYQSIRLAPLPGGDLRLSASGFLPEHPVSLSVGGRPVATLTANAKGNVGYFISPKALKLRSGPHQVTLTSLLITETATW
jgi:hypothetical protein